MDFMIITVCLHHKDFESLRLDTKAGRFVFSGGETPQLSGVLVDKSSGKRRDVKLVPMGQTILRRVTFPVQ